MAEPRHATDDEAREIATVLAMLARTLSWRRAFDYLACFPEFRHAAHAAHKRSTEQKRPVEVADGGMMLAYYFLTQMDMVVRDYEKEATKPVNEHLYEVMDL